MHTNVAIVEAPRGLLIERKPSIAASGQFVEEDSRSETAILIINEFVLVLRWTSLKNVSTTKLFPANAAKLTTAMSEVRTIELIGEHTIVSSKVEFSNIYRS